MMEDIVINSEDSRMERSKSERLYCCRCCDCYCWKTCTRCCQFPSCYCTFSLSIRKCLKELLFASIPISIAAALSQFIQSIIIYITVRSRTRHGSNDAISLQLGQSFVYCIIMFSGGKYFTLWLQKAELELQRSRSNPEKPNNLIGWISWLKKEQYLPILFNLLGENAGFAWRSFAVMFVLSYFYQNYGLGAAFASFLLWVLMVCVLVIIAYGFLDVLTISNDLHNHGSHQKLYQEAFSDFHSDSFSLSIAFVLTVLVALCMNNLFGSEFVDEGGYLFAWQSKTDDDVHSDSVSYYSDGSYNDNDYGYNYYSYFYFSDDSVSDESVNSFYFLYCIAVTLVLAIVLVIEDRLGCVSHRSEESVEEDVIDQSSGNDCESKKQSIESKGDLPCDDSVVNPLSSVPSESSMEETSTITSTTGDIHCTSKKPMEQFEISQDMVDTKESKNNHALNISFAIRLWNQVGTTLLDGWHCVLGCLNGVAWFTLLVDELLAYTSGDKVATLIVFAVIATIITWRAPFFINAITAAQEKAKERWESYSNKSQKEFIPVHCQDYVFFPFHLMRKGIYKIAKYYYHLKVRRKSLYLVSLRLTIGWMWEEFIVEIVQYLIEEKKYSKRSSIAVNFISLIIILLFSLIIHRCIRNIDQPAISEVEDLMNNDETESIA